jgi:hypothetical protein
VTVEFVDRYLLADGSVVERMPAAQADHSKMIGWRVAAGDVSYRVACPRYSPGDGRPVILRGWLLDVTEVRVLVALGDGVQPSKPVHVQDARQLVSCGVLKPANTETPLPDEFAFANEFLRMLFI